MTISTPSVLHVCMSAVKLRTVINAHSVIELKSRKIERIVFKTIFSAVTFVWIGSTTTVKRNKN